MEQEADENGNKLKKGLVSILWELIFRKHFSNMVPFRISVLIKNVPFSSKIFPLTKTRSQMSAKVTWGHSRSFQGRRKIQILAIIACCEPIQFSNCQLQNCQFDLGWPRMTSRDLFRNPSFFRVKFTSEKNQNITTKNIMRLKRTW